MSRLSSRTLTTVFRDEDGEETVLPSHGGTQRRSYMLMNGHVGAIPDAQKSHCMIIDPLWKSKMCWDTLVFALIAYQVLIIPVELAFDEENTFSVPYNAWWAVDFVMGFFFLVDLVVNCFTSYISKDGLVVLDQYQIMRNYALTPPFHLFIDMAALLPFFIGFIELSQVDETNVDSSAGSIGKVSKSGRFFRYMRLIRVMRLLRLAKAMKFVQVLERAFIFYGRFSMLMASFLKICLSICCIVHLLACLWRSLSDFEQHAAKFAVDVEDVWASYSLCVWFTMSTLCGNGPTPGSMPEMWFLSFFLLIALSLANVYIAVLVKVFDTFQDERSELNQKLRITKRFISAHPMEEKMKAKVLGAVRSSFKQKRATGSFKGEVEPLLSQDLRQQLHGNIHTPVLRCFPPFADPSPLMQDLCSKLSAEASVQVYTMGNLIFQEGAIESSMVFVAEGQALLHSKTYGIEINLVREKWFFGENSLFRDEQQARRKASLFALRSCTILEIDRELFRSAVKDCNLDTWLSAHTKRASKIGGVSTIVSKEGGFGCPACQGNGGEAGHWVDKCEILVPWFADGRHKSIPKPLSEVGSLAYNVHQQKLSHMSYERRTNDMVFKYATGTGSKKTSKLKDGGFDKDPKAVTASEMQELSDTVRALQQKLDAMMSKQQEEAEAEVEAESEVDAKSEADMVSEAEEEVEVDGETTSI